MCSMGAINSVGSDGANKCWGLIAISGIGKVSVPPVTSQTELCVLFWRLDCDDKIPADIDFTQKNEKTLAAGMLLRGQVQYKDERHNRSR